jgi:hypothetical protein
VSDNKHEKLASNESNNGPLRHTVADHRSANGLFRIRRDCQFCDNNKRKFNIGEIDLCACAMNAVSQSCEPL